MGGNGSYTVAFGGLDIGVRHQRRILIQNFLLAQTWDWKVYLSSSFDVEVVTSSAVQIF